MVENQMDQVPLKEEFPYFAIWCRQHLPKCRSVRPWINHCLCTDLKYLPGRSCHTQLHGFEGSAAEVDEQEQQHDLRAARQG